MNETEHHRSHPVRHFFRHFLEMVAAMVVAMFVLGGLVYLGFYLVGVDLFDIPPEVFLLGMAATMGIGMAAWMRHRQHEWPGILEMGGAMLASFIVLIPPYWLDAISVEAMFGLGHVLMLPAMLLVMIHRRLDFVQPVKGDLEPAVVSSSKET